MRLISNEAVAPINEPPGGRGDTCIQRWSNSSFLIVGCLLLFCFCLAIRIPLRTRLLSGWDPAQFAFAIHHFDIRKDHPQPPGYLVFVELARMMFRLVHDDNLALTTLAALFSALSAVLIFLLAFEIYDRRTALLASAVWATCPLVWFHGLAGEIYAAAGFASVATALSVFLFMRSPSRSMAICVGGVYALAAGLRPDQLLLMAPLFLFPFWRSAACRRWTVFALSSAVPVYLAWYLPTVASAGGYSNYARLVRNQLSDAVKTGSIFFGGSPIAHVWMLTRVVSGLALGVLPLLIVLAIWWATRRPSAQAGWKGGDELLLLIVWAAPFLLFYSLIFIGRVAYCVACLPPVLLLLSRWLVLKVAGLRPEGARRFWYLVLFCLAVNSGFFFLLPRFPEPTVPAESFSLSQLVPEALNRSILSCGYDQIRFDQSVKRRYFEEIRRLLSGDTAVVLIQLGPPDCLNARILEYYFPSAPLYTALGGREPIPGYHRAPSLPGGSIQNQARLSKEGKGGEQGPILAVKGDRVLLLHAKNLQVEIKATNGSALEVETGDRDDRSDIYQVYVLRLTPASLIDVSSGGKTVSIVERP
jgi:4-amino-4-deoxy-L-arabinose transferase-like glycosyltransferase